MSPCNPKASLIHALATAAVGAITELLAERRRRRARACRCKERERVASPAREHDSMSTPGP